MMISIHAAQEGCDRVQKWYSEEPRTISIHAAQEGCDFMLCVTVIAGRERFQSTQPKRAATKLLKAL